MQDWSKNWSGRLSRRGVLTLVAAGVGEIGALAASAAAGAHFASASAATTTTAPTKSTTQPKTVNISGPLAAFVPDDKGNTIVIMRGDQETTITNPTLVQALLSFSSSF